MKKTRLVVLSVFVLSLFVVTACKQKVEETQEAVADEMEEMVEETEEAMEEVTYTMPTVNIAANETVSSPLYVQLNSQGLWMGYEGEVGWAKLVDESGNELASGILKAEGDWMKSGPVMYGTNLEFDATGHSNGTLIIQQNAGPGEGDEAGESASFEVPVNF